jgi:parvulin-like peptidyl-prolyl isomerase
MNKTAYSFPERVRLWLAPLVVLLLLAAVYGLVSLRVAAWVGGTVISRAELLTRIRVVQFVYDRQFGRDPDYDADWSKKYQHEVLDQMAEETVLLPAAEGLATPKETDEYAASAVEWIKSGYFANDDSKWQAELTKLGIDEQDLRAYFANNLLLTRLHGQQVKDVTVDEAAAKAYYDEHKPEFDLPELVKVSHIVVQTRAEAEQLQQQVQAGADFASLAKANSLDAESAALGGSLRWFQAGEMERSFEQAAFALEPGQLSDIVETSEGFHLIKMESRQPAKNQEYDVVSSLAKARALEAKQEAVWNQYRRTMRGQQLILLLAR